MYGKIFDSMYEGTLYGHWEAIVTLQQMLVLCDSAGTIDMTPQAISARTSIPLEIITKGVKVLSDPDPYTRTPGEEGRRIVLLDDHRPWGWRIVNHAVYRAMKSQQDKLEADRLRMADKRKNNKISNVAGSRKESHHVAEVAHADADAETDVNANLKSKTISSTFTLPEWVDAKAWAGFVAMRKTIKKPLTEHALPLAIKKLEKLRSLGHDPKAVLEQSTFHSWQGLFEIKADTGVGGNGKGDMSWLFSEKGTQAKGQELGIEARPGESMDAYRDRLRTHSDD